jgi:hypothetical protein
MANEIYAAPGLRATRALLLLTINIRRESRCTGVRRTYWELLRSKGAGAEGKARGTLPQYKALA